MSQLPDRELLPKEERYKSRAEKRVIATNDRVAGFYLCPNRNVYGHLEVEQTSSE
jgi:hypothetical protein